MGSVDWVRERMQAIAASRTKKKIDAAAEKINEYSSKGLGDLVAELSYMKEAQARRLQKQEQIARLVREKKAVFSQSCLEDVARHAIHKIFDGMKDSKRSHKYGRFEAFKKFNTELSCMVCDFPDLQDYMFQEAIERELVDAALTVFMFTAEGRERYLEQLQNEETLITFCRTEGPLELKIRILSALVNMCGQEVGLSPPEMSVSFNAHKESALSVATKILDPKPLSKWMTAQEEQTVSEVRLAFERAQERGLFGDKDLVRMFDTVSNWAQQRMAFQRAELKLFGEVSSEIEALQPAAA